MSETFQLSARYYVPAYWWIATELVRRNQQLDLIETYPMDGFYDCLTLIGQSGNGPIHIDLNRLGSIHIHPEHISLMSGAEVVSQDNAHWAVKKIERVARLSPVDTAPLSNARLITLRLMARVVNYLVNDRSVWTLRMMTPAGDGLSLPLAPNDSPALFTDKITSQKLPLPEVFPTARLHQSFLIASGLPEEFEAGRFWGLQRDELTVAVFDTEGVVHTRNARTALKPLYARSNRNLTQTMTAALADVLP